VRGGGENPPDPTDPAVRSARARMRVIDGALSCLATQGVAKTTLDDVARHAGCSRATVYRVFPGGKDAVLQAAFDTEVSRFFSGLAVPMGEADNLEDVLVAGITEAASRVSGHRALTYLLDHEPELVLPHLAFAHFDDMLSVTCAFTAPFLGRWLDTAEARRVAEWAARIVLSYLSCPVDGVDLTAVSDVRRLVRQFVLPGIRALQTADLPTTNSQETNSQETSRLTPVAKGEAS
jgi:AcrR family transcriptional regulator